MCCSKHRNMFAVKADVTRTPTDRQTKGQTESNRQNIGDKTIHLIALFVFFFLLFCLPFRSICTSYFIIIYYIACASIKPCFLFPLLTSFLFTVFVVVEAIC